MSPPEPIDMTVLEGLREVMEDDFDEVLSDYLTQCDELWRDAQAQLAAGDMTLLRRSAHTFKGSCMSVGAEPLMQQMKALEAAAGTEDRAAAEALMRDAEQEIERVVSALQAVRGA